MVHKLREWHVLSDRDEMESRKIFQAVLDGDLLCKEIYRDNWRTLSAQVLIDGESILLKIPRARNGRRWERFLTLLRGSDAFRHFRHLERMSEMGLNAPVPVLAAEFRRRGMVIDSFVCYHFVEGRRPEPADAPAVLDALKALHRKGYLRSDAQLANFLIGENGEVVFIDFRLKRPWFLTELQKAREVDRFLRSCPEASSCLSSTETSSLWFQMAHALENFSFARRRWKRNFRDLRHFWTGKKS